jgi:hypothetical protein
VQEPSTITPAILDTVLGHLAPHFMASTGNDLPSARHAASRLLAAYNAETEEELSLSAEIISFSFHALEALGEAADPDLSLTRKLRLRGSAVSLSRESHKSQRKLDQLQRARHLGAAAAAPQDQAVAPESAQPATPPPAKPPPAAPAWPLSRQQRRAAERTAEKLRRKQAENERREVMLRARIAPQPIAPQPIAHQPTAPTEFQPQRGAA